MPVTTFTGVVLGSYATDPFPPMAPRNWGPSTLSDIHDGGAEMWVGGAAIMFVLIMTVFFGWTRETRPSGGMGWLETGRRANLAARVEEAVPEAVASKNSHPSHDASIDEDEEHLAAYNAYLSRIN